MILSQLRDYLRQRGQASLQDMALHFDADPGAVRAMLEHLRRKGRVTRRAATPSCGGSCTQCDSAAVELYFWSEGGEPPAAVFPLRDLRCPK